MKSGITNLGEKKISVRELTIKDIKDLFDMPDSSSVADRLAFLLDKSCSGLEQKELLNFAPSDLEPLIKDMLKVNASFFESADQIGMGEAAGVLKKLIQAISIGVLLP